jgi:hypothetical protein
MSALSDDSKVNMTNDKAVTRKLFHCFFLRVVTNIAEKTDKSIMSDDISGLILRLQVGRRMNQTSSR